MNKAGYIIIFSCLLILLSGCLKTLYPIFFEKDVVFSEKLLGQWKFRENKQVKFLEFEKIPSARLMELAPGARKISGKGYLVSRKDSLGDLISQCFVFLVSIDKKYYLDFYPAETASQKKINGFYKSHHLKVHSSYRVEFGDKDHFTMRMFDKGFLDKLISTHQINIRHQNVDGHITITAPTEELQQFIIQYSDNPKAYTGAIECERSFYY